MQAIIPAAGFGTRFLPLKKAQPKEMLPVVNKPLNFGSCFERLNCWLIASITLNPISLLSSSLL